MLLFNRLQGNMATHRSYPLQTHSHSVPLPLPEFSGVGLQRGKAEALPGPVCVCTQLLVRLSLVGCLDIFAHKKKRTAIQK